MAPLTLAIVTSELAAAIAFLGGLSARAGGAEVIIGAMRVTFWGGLAMAMTAGIGWLFGTVV